ncbi:MAG TPA: cytochrome P450 [Actinophytocola sp.]|nr:cytochrome P450 [Actinophytocola sp.]
MAGKCPIHENPMPFDAQFSSDPYGYYGEKHAEGPIHRVCIPGGDPVWLVTGYDEVYQLLRDKRLARPRQYANADYTNTRALEGAPEAPLVMQDPPEHTRGRRLVNYAFIPKRIEALVPRMHEIVDGMLDRIADDGKADLMEALVVPFPITVIADIVGVPDEERAQFQAWGDALFSTAPPEVAAKAFGELTGFIARLTEERSVEPQDDLVSLMLNGTHKDGEPVTQQEVRHLATILIAAGYDTTVGSIAAGLIGLLSRPEKMAELRADPGLLPSATEELLRLYSSVQRGFRRFATEEMVIGGTTVSAGDTVYLGIGAADRDPGRFADPQEMDFHREDNQHIAFGRGPHVCPASELARVEVRLVLEKVLTRFPNIELAVPPEHVEWRESDFIRMPTSIPVTF